jgi:hypothetical protein
VQHRELVATAKAHGAPPPKWHIEQVPTQRETRFDDIALDEVEVGRLLR